MMTMTRGKKAAQTRERNKYAKVNAERNAEADRIYEKLKTGVVLTFKSLGTYVDDHGNKYSSDAIRVLRERGLAKHTDGKRIVLSSPEEYEAEQKERDDARADKRQARLDKWREMILASGATAAELDKTLWEIAREAMSLSPDLGD